MRFTIWLSREEGLRAVAAAKSKYQRDLVMGVEPWDGQRPGIRRASHAGSFGASRRSLLEVLRRARIQATIELQLPFIEQTATWAVDPGPSTGSSQMPAGLAYWTSRPTLVIGSVAPGFVDDKEKNGRRLAAALVVASAGRDTQAPSDELTEWLRAHADVEELFAAIDGRPRRRICPQCGGRGDLTCESCGGSGYDGEQAETREERAVRESKDSEATLARLTGGSATWSEDTVEPHPTETVTVTRYEP